MEEVHQGRRLQQDPISISCRPPRLRSDRGSQVQAQGRVRRFLKRNETHGYILYRPDLDLYVKHRQFGAMLTTAAVFAHVCKLNTSFHHHILFSIIVFSPSSFFLYHHPFSIIPICVPGLFGTLSFRHRLSQQCVY